MDCAHDRANESFDVPAKVRPARRTVNQLNSILPGPPFQRFGLELLGIVQAVAHL
jgi:hypothetical protein